MGHNYDFPWLLLLLSLSLLSLLLVAVLSLLRLAAFCLSGLDGTIMQIDERRPRVAICGQSASRLRHRAASRGSSLPQWIEPTTVGARTMRPSPHQLVRRPKVVLTRSARDRSSRRAVCGRLFERDCSCEAAEARQLGPDCAAPLDVR
jgi:hypothetical protein